MTGYDAQKGDILASVDDVYQIGVADGKALQSSVDQPALAQAAADLQGMQGERDAAVAALAAYEATHPDAPPVDPPPASKTAVFSVYAGPIGTEGGQTAATRARVAKALGVPVLPVDRVYSSTSFGKAVACPSPRVAVSYGQVPALAKGDATVIKNLTAELTALAKTGQKYDVSADHEVDSKIRGGSYTGAQVKAAAAQLKKIVAGIGSPNLRPTMCFTGYGLTLPTSDPSHPENYFDPASVDLIALDPYWPTQKTAALAFDAGWKWASSTGKPVAVWETGWSTDSNPQAPTDAQVTTKVAAIIDYWKTKAEYVLFFESSKGDNLLEEHPAALALWSAEMR